MKKYIATILILGGLTGCATPVFNTQPAVSTISEPLIQIISTASIGDPLLKQGLATVYDTIKLNGEQKISIIKFDGSYRKVGDTNEHEFFFAGQASPYSHITLKIEKATGNTCFIGDGYHMCSNPPQKLAFERSKETIYSTTSLQQTLYYNGKVGQKINIGYREFSGDIARPAFSNDVEYDLQESKIIAYKGALIEVISANNQSIKYKVLKNFR